MPKINVYVPDELHLRLRAEEIAVSPICQQALEEVVQARELKRRATKTIRGVADRLVAGRDRQRVAERADGYAEGTEWARTTASLDELDRVDRAHRRSGEIPYSSVPSFVGWAYGRWPEADVDPNGWFEPAAKPYDDGFIAAASDVYQAAKPLIDAHDADAAKPTRQRTTNIKKRATR